MCFYSNVRKKVILENSVFSIVSKRDYSRDPCALNCDKSMLF